ncbi:MAG: hypothetical protein J6C81_02445 [Muribaculaceae bacterium]|nr:hypothetical protein [Muribaculaceae bacterium]
MKKIALSLATAIILASSASAMAANVQQKEGEDIRTEQQDNKNKKDRKDKKDKKGKKDKKKGKRHGKRARDCRKSPCINGNTCGDPECRPGENPCCPLPPCVAVCPEGDEDVLRPFPAGSGAPAADCCFQRPPRRDNEREMHARPFHKDYDAFQGITLTPSQQQKLNELNDKQRGKLKKEFNKAKEKREKMRAEAEKKRDKMRSSYEKDLREILTPEQYMQYKQNEAERQQVGNRNGVRNRQHARRAECLQPCNVKKVRKAAEPPMQYDNQPETVSPAEK